MNITRNAVYDYVHTAVATVHPNAYIASIYEPVPPSLPAVFIRETNDYRNRETMTFTGVQGVRTSTFEVQTVSSKTNGSMSEAYALLESVRQAFFALNYNEINVSIVEDGQYGKYRLRASYRRVIGDADIMPT